MYTFFNIIFTENRHFFLFTFAPQLYLWHTPVLQTHLTFLDKIHILMNMDNFVFSLFAMQLYILQNRL